jgi:uncharacterized protein DUF6491
MNRFFLFSIVLLFLASCTTTQSNLGQHEPIYQNYIDKNKLESVKKITTFRFQGWRSLDYKFLIVNAALYKPYLLELTSYCSELRSANSINIINSGSILQTKFDYIKVANSGTSAVYREKCFIKSIYKLTREQSDQIIKLKATPKASKA